MAPISGYFDEVFGNAGNLTVVPDAVQIDGSISYTDGWGAFYSQDPAVDPSTALLIDRAQTNQLFFDVTSALQYFQQGNAAAFITSTMNGGSPYSYPAGAVVLNSGVTYVSLVNTNTDTPPSSQWAVIALGTALVASNNLNDLGTLATALTNLGFASNSTNYFKIPNPNNTAKPWIIQFGQGVGQTPVTFTVTFPNAVIGLYGSLRNIGTPLYTCFSATSLTTSGFTPHQYDAATAADSTDPNYWLAIGN